jgi:hypothetical protein
VVLAQRASDDHVLVVSTHHAVFDGWSGGVFFRDLARAYTDAVRHVQPAWDPLGIQPVDHAHWQHAWLRARQGRAAVEALASIIADTSGIRAATTAHLPGEAAWLPL